MSDAVTVAIVAGGFTLATVLVQVFGVRINSRQHGDSMVRLERIEQAQIKAASELLEHREGSQTYREVQADRHDQNVKSLKQIVSRIDAVDAHVKAVDERVKHLEGDTQ